MKKICGGSLLACEFVRNHNSRSKTRRKMKKMDSTFAFFPSFTVEKTSCCSKHMQCILMNRSSSNTQAMTAFFPCSKDGQHFLIMLSKMLLERRIHTRFNYCFTAIFCNFKPDNLLIYAEVFSCTSTFFRTLHKQCNKLAGSSQH